MNRLRWIFATGDARDAEILALRHQILVLQRQINRPHFTDAAYAERWVRSLRHELLDRTIIWNETQLRRLLDDYIEHYNTHRPHQGINERAPNDQGIVVPIRPGHPIQRHTTCNGLINQYRPAA